MARDTGTDAEGAAAFEFVNDYLDDLERGRARPLADYLKRFPGCEERIAEEYVLLRTEAAATDGDAAVDERDRVGPYRIVRELGRGGQGEVFEAEDTRIDRRVALKLLHGAFVSEERRRRFRREAEVIARLEHPGICGIHEADIDGATPYIAMRFVRGEVVGASLLDARADRPRRAGALPWCPRTRADLHRVLHFFERAARALHAAHEAGIVHRDVKPGNLVESTEGAPVILDFGLAQDDRAEGLTQTGDVFGTPAYMSPEQLRGTGLDGRSDVYSLGVALYEALTLRRPFEGDDRIALERAILYEPVPDPRPSNPQVNEDVKVVLDTALEKDTGRRYGSALELAEDLRRIREYEPIRARSAGAALRFRRWVRRQPALAATLISTFVLLGAGLAYSSYLLAREREALADKERALEFAKGRHFAERSAKLLAEDPSEALALGIEAVALAPHYLTRSALFAALDACHLERILEVDGARRFWDLVLSPDGRTAAAAPDDGTVHVWDVASGNPLHAFEGAAGAVRRLAYDREGRRLAGVSDEGVLLVWDVTSGVLARRVAVCSGPALWVEFSPDGAFVVVQPAEEPARVFDTDGFSVIASLATDPLNAGCARFSADGRRILTASRGLQGLPETRSTSATLWDAASGERIATLDGHEGDVVWAEFGPVGERIATASEDGTARLWDARSGAALGAPLAHEGPVFCATFSPDGRSLATTTSAGARSRAWIWDLASRERIALEGHEDMQIVQASFSADGTRLATCAFDQTVRVWDVASGALLRTLRTRFRPLAACWTPDGRRVLTLSNSPRAHVWRTGNQAYAYRLEGHRGPVRWASFTPDGRRALTASEDGTLRLWDAGPETGEQDPGALVREYRGHADAVHSASFTPDGTRVLSLSRDGTARLWDVERGVEVRSPLVHPAVPVAAAFRPDGELLATVDEEGGAWLWRLATDAPPERLTGQDAGVRCARFSPGGEWLASAGEADVVLVRDGTTGVVVQRIEFESAVEGYSGVHGLDFHPELSEFVAACADLRVRYWDPATGRATRPPAHTFRDQRACYGPNGRRLLLTGSMGGASLRVLDFAEERTVFPEVVHNALITSAAFSADGRLVVSSARDASVLVWDAALGKPAARHTQSAGPVTWAAFSPIPGDERVITACADGTASVWPINPYEAAVARRPRELRPWQWAREERLAQPPEGR